MKEREVFCLGIHCSVKNTCKRYTSGLVAVVNDGTNDAYIRTCTSQKKYVQDVNKINTDSKRT